MATCCGNNTNCPDPPESDADPSVNYCPEDLALAQEANSGQLLVRADECMYVLTGQTCGYIKFDPETGNSFVDLPGLPEAFLEPEMYGYPIYGVAQSLTDGEGTIITRYCPVQADPEETPEADLAGFIRSCDADGVRPAVVAPTEYNPGYAECPPEGLKFLASYPVEFENDGCTTTRPHWLETTTIIVPDVHDVPEEDPDINPDEGDLPAMGLAAWKQTDCGDFDAFQLVRINGDALQKIIVESLPDNLSDWVALPTPYKIGGSGAGSGVESDYGVAMTPGNTGTTGGDFDITLAGAPANSSEVRLRASAGFSCRGYTGDLFGLVQVAGFTHAYASVTASGGDADDRCYNTFEANVDTGELEGVSITSGRSVAGTAGAFAELWMTHYRL